MTVLTTQAEVDEALRDDEKRGLDIVIPEGVTITLGPDTRKKVSVYVSGPGQVILDRGYISRVFNGGNVTIRNGGTVRLVNQGGVVSHIIQGEVLYLQEGGLIRIVESSTEGVLEASGGVIEYITPEGYVKKIVSNTLVHVNRGLIGNLYDSVVEVNRGIIDYVVGGSHVEYNRGIISKAETKSSVTHNKGQVR